MGSDSDSRVGNSPDGIGIISVQGHLNLPTRGGIFNGIGNEIGPYLPHVKGVYVHGGILADGHRQS